MRPRALPIVALVSLASAAHAARALRPDPPIACESCDAWNAPREPFRVFGNTYYVGVAGLSAVLVVSEGGLILLDGGLPQSAARIDASIRKLGFRTADIRLIVNSHAHFDHAGGIAALQRASGAVVAASAESARALEAGEPLADDPQHAFGREANRFPPVGSVRVVGDGETLRVGDVAITAHLTPGHTPGGTTWTWRSCEDGRCLDVVYADSLNPVSAPGFRFTGDASRPDIVGSFRGSIATVERLPCDILLTVHPGFGGVDAKGDGRAEACRAYAADAAEKLDRRVAEERRDVEGGSG